MQPVLIWWQIPTETTEMDPDFLLKMLLALRSILEWKTITKYSFLEFTVQTLRSWTADSNFFFLRFPLPFNMILAHFYLQNLQLEIHKISHAIQRCYIAASSYLVNLKKCFTIENQINSCHEKINIPKLKYNNYVLHYKISYINNAVPTKSLKKKNQLTSLNFI